MTEKTNYSEHFKMEVLEEICRMFFQNKFNDINHLPFKIIPKGSESRFRCCTYKEWGILKLRTLASFGYSVNDIDEALPLSDYLLAENERKYKTNNKLLTVLESACSACVKSRYMVSEICQGCLARKCENACPFGAISQVDHKAKIDIDKCKNCGKCADACPYNAILKMVVPCEEACPVNAIKKDDKGRANIDHSLCISCGKCMTACPFGAIMERRQILDVLRHLNTGRLAAIVAPSVLGQFGISASQMKTVLKELGFEYFYEAAYGADVTSEREAKEFKEKIVENKQNFMTTSCCHAYVRLVKKHIPQLKPFVSDTRTPMHYTAVKAKTEHPDCVTVFIGPCLSKRKEAQGDFFVNFVMTFQELSAMIKAKGINIAEVEDSPLDIIPTKEGRMFAVRCGVAQAVKSRLSDEDKKLVKEEVITNIDKKTVLKLSIYANKKDCCQSNLIEVMACEGGCVGGCGTMRQISKSAEDVKKFSLPNTEQTTDNKSDMK